MGCGGSGLLYVYLRGFIMDLRIHITDENNVIMEYLVIYQDGSDSEGTAQISKWIRSKFDVEDED